jgi:hypothetical protein
MFMNEYEIDMYRHRFDPVRQPNLNYLAQTVQHLSFWADRNSDGWAHWPKPAKAARKAMEVLYEHRLADRDFDITDREFTAALSPIKSFLTRQGVKHVEVLP